MTRLPALPTTLLATALLLPACKVGSDGDDDIGDSETSADGSTTGDGTGTETTTDSDTTDSDTTDSDTTDSDTTDSEGSTTTTGGEATDQLDILFIVDNSGTMGPAQAALAGSIEALIDPLEAAGVNWRVGVTTTDNGNPWCPVGVTTPEAGNLVLSSCKDRLSDFLFGDQIDATDIACNDVCTLNSEALEVLPTATEVDAQPKPHPWVERTDGALNLGTDDAAAALRCFLPQGVAGCGFESPLESMYLGLVRAVTNSEENYGFLRQSAATLVIIVSDEADCSLNKNFSTIFDQDGAKAFWSDPNSPFPTSAVCWNAGVTCTGDPQNYDECYADNKSELGEGGVIDSEAVLHPLSRYDGLLQGLADDKGTQLRVGLIGGVNDQGEAFYGDVDVTDPAFQNSFGIGPGCQAPVNGELYQAVPPVRMLEIQEGRSAGTYTICEDSYAGALGAMAEFFIE